MDKTNYVVCFAKSLDPTDWYQFHVYRNATDKERTPQITTRIVQKIGDISVSYPAYDSLLQLLNEENLRDNPLQVSRTLVEGKYVVQVNICEDKWLSINFISRREEKPYVKSLIMPLSIARELAKMKEVNSLVFAKQYNPENQRNNGIGRELGRWTQVSEARKRVIKAMKPEALCEGCRIFGWEPRRCPCGRAAFEKLCDEGMAREFTSNFAAIGRAFNTDIDNKPVENLYALACFGATNSMGDLADVIYNMVAI
jgi:hypothetical protein